MFASRADALTFRDDLVAELASIETDGWHAKPTLEGAELYLGMSVARVRGRLDSRGYRVHDRTAPKVEQEGWNAMLEVRPS